MISLVLELQTLASSSTSTLPELLRKAKLVAFKLGLSDFQKWINCELEGYKDFNDVPPYRVVHCELQARNPYRGLVPMYFDNTEIAHKLKRVEVMEGVGSLLSVLEASTNGMVTLPFTEGLKKLLRQWQTNATPFEPIRQCGSNQIAGILDVVQSKLLDWSLELEKQGILGEGMTFSKEEKERAHTNINIQTFQGIMGDVTHSSVTQNLELHVKAGDFNSLATQLIKDGVRTKEIEELRSAITEDGKPATKGKLGTKVAAWLERVSTSIGTSAAGGTIARAIGAYFDF